ncbi:COPII coat GTPase [Verticillium nonalfalfae]|uniref:Small COPII coat GTPase SAR1 n=1 Tax=Verticillium nonalfalfae TaxID=1051616 RepID=A0A3M9Y206_9PEZI|nr:COPII coat GTPase [Verticillium nonalfalfae]RNJ54523.1 COPII coat GTPase [Verticillium nonalfalfae]
MWFIDSVVNFVRSFGFFEKQGKVLFLGLDNAGKTTLLGQIAANRRVAMAPTVHPNNEQIKVGNVVFDTFDLGGRQGAPRLWQDYLVDANAVFFLVDATDRARFPEARAELEALWAMEELRNTPFVILGNKIDRPLAVGEAELYDKLGLGPEGPCGNRAVKLFMCSVKMRQGYIDGFYWLEKNL